MKWVLPSVATDIGFLFCRASTGHCLSTRCLPDSPLCDGQPAGHTSVVAEPAEVIGGGPVAHLIGDELPVGGDVVNVRSVRQGPGGVDRPVGQNDAERAGYAG